jgi:hypothetical protein
MVATTPKRRSPRGIVAVALATFAASLTVLPGAAPIQAAPPAANPWDVSSAMRYNANGTMIGSVVRSLVNTDDVVTTYPGAFPLNFFGTKYDNVCISANGGVYLVNDAPKVTDATSTIATGDCSTSYDYSTSYMAISSGSPFITILATDHMTGRDVHLSPTWRTQDLKITSVTNAGGTATFTTNDDHGLVPNAEVTIAAMATGGYNGVKTVLAAPTPTTFTVSVAGGDEDPAPAAATVARKRTYGNLTSVTGDGTTVTVTTAAAHKLGTGDYITFAGTGITAIDDKHFSVTRTGASTLTFPQPTGFDASTAINLTANYKWFQSDGYGAIGQIYFGTTTVDGRAAMVVSWYRIGMYADDNPKVRTSTIQLVLVQKATGNGTAGWDFDVEFNYGAMTDDEDGYAAPNYNANGTTEGSTAGSWTADPTDPNGGRAPANARWGIGWASYREITDAQNWKIEYCASKCLITITTLADHGLKAGDLINFNDVNGAPFQGHYGRAVSGTGGTKLMMIVPGRITTYTNTAQTDLVTGGATELRVADDYEIFPYTWIGDLVEQSASTNTRMTSNNMNAPTIPGRYTFQMIGGRTVGFEAPSMGRPSAPRALTAYFKHYPYDPTTATVNFQPSLIDGGNAITTYTVRMIPDTGAGDCVITLPGALNCFFTGLLATQTYKVEVFASNSVGDSNVTVADIGWDPGTPLTEEEDAAKGPTSEPKPYVGADGQPPQLAPGKTVMYVGGEAIDLNIAPTTLPSGVQVLKLSSGGSTGGGRFEMTIGGDCPTCSISQNNSGDNVLGMSQSAGVRVGGYGFGPGSQVNVFINSTTRLIGFFKADGDGAFLGTVKVPTDLPGGNHTIQVSGFTADNVIRSVSVGVTVAKSAPRGCRTTKVKGKTRTVCPTKPTKKKVVKKK